MFKDVSPPLIFAAASLCIFSELKTAERRFGLDLPDDELAEVAERIIGRTDNLSMYRLASAGRGGMTAALRTAIEKELEALREAISDGGRS